MRNVRWLVAAGLLVAATGCVETNGYPTTSYGGYPSSGYYGQPAYSNGYYSQPTYYRPAPTYYYQQPVQTRYVAVPVPSQPRYVPSSRSSWGSRDSDGDGIPNRYDRDKNNDGIPDRQQRRGWNGPG